MSKVIIVGGRAIGKTCCQVAEEAQRLRLIEEPFVVVIDECCSTPLPQELERLKLPAEVLETAIQLISEPTKYQRKKSKGQKFGKSKYF